MQKKNSTDRARIEKKILQETVSTLQARMRGDMAQRGYSPFTQKVYVRAVKQLAQHYNNRSPELISIEEAQCYLRLLKKRKVSNSALSTQTGGIRFLFEVTFGKIWKPVSPLRQRMLEDMDMRGFSVRTQLSYGGQIWHCGKCGRAHPACHSCGNRHCPTCGGDDAKLWHDRQMTKLLPVSYFLCTFTVPEELREVIASKPKEWLALLFDASSSSLTDLCQNPKWFGAIPGITGVLHTWSRAMIYHPHIHYLVTGGGFDQTGIWRWPKNGFLVPAHALSRVYRERFKAGLKKANPAIFETISHKVWNTDWVVDVKGVGNGEKALKYLTRYIFRVALTDSSITHHDDNHVIFRYRKSDSGKSASITLTPFKFLHRFLQHVLPKGFVKVRYYGLHLPARRKTLALARAALCLHYKLPIPATPPPASPKPPPSCPVCRTPLVQGMRFRPGQMPPSHAPPE